MTELETAMVEVAAQAQMRLRMAEYGWSEQEFQMWWTENRNFTQQVHSWGWFTGTEKEKLLFEFQTALEAIGVVGQKWDTSDLSPISGPLV